MKPSFKTVQKRYSYSARHKSDEGMQGIVKRHDIQKAKEFSAKARGIDRKEVKGIRKALTNAMKD